LAAFTPDNPAMKTLIVIFVLALVTIGGEIYSDFVLTAGQVAPAAGPDPAAVAVGHAAKQG
jgi:hypothetical protein